DGLKAEFIRLEITTLKENTYFAKILLKFNGAIKYIDCRPSDGIALALKFEAPILVAEDLMKEEDSIAFSSGKNQPIGLEEVRRFRKSLESLKAEDFWKKLKGGT
ncbi:MAG: hypothetical protein COW28_01100, partial [bacterium (Candidatus Ratteibacteria) CG15_BIG_FIL_POST_REV_8_21_14_020_41_12]